MAIPTVEQYMTRVPYTIERTACLDDAHKLMRRHQIHHLPVLEAGALIGLLSMSDLHLLESLDDIDTATVPVDDAMTEKPVTAPPSASLFEVAAQMASLRISSVVVVRDDAVVGVFTTHDALIALVHRWKDER